MGECHLTLGANHSTPGLAGFSAGGFFYERCSQMAYRGSYRGQSRARGGAYRSSRSGGYRSRSTLGRRAPRRAGRGSRSVGGGRQQTVKIVLQTVQAPATSSPFAQQVETKPDRAKY